MASAFPDNSYLEIQLTDLWDSVLYCPFDEDAINQVDDSDPSTESGAIIYPSHVTPRVGAGAVQLAEATANLWINPSFEVDVTTGVLISGNNTNEQSTDKVKVGTYSCKSTYIDDQYIWRTGTNAITAAGALEHHLHAWVYIPSNWDGGTLRWRTLNFISGSPSTTDLDMDKTDQWQFVDTYITPDVGDLTGDIGLQIVGGSPTAGRFIYIDAVQFENKDYPTPIAIGDMGTGHTWSGTEHASTSIRTDATLTYSSNDISPSEGTIAGWFRSSNDLRAADGINTFPLFNLGNVTYDQAGSLQVFFFKSATGFYARIRDDDAYRTLADLYPFAPDTNTWFFVVFTWKENDYFTGYVFDQDGTLTTQSIAMTTNASWDGDLTVGYGYESKRLPGWSDELVVLDYAVTAAQAKSLHYEGMDGIPFTGIWTDILGDVRQRDLLSWRGGITGNMPRDRTAGTGSMEFVLKNDDTNSAGLLGYYSVGHANARVGFELGKRVRLWFIEGGERFYHFIGTLTKATPTTGKQRERKTECRAVDWLAAAAMHKVDLIDVADDIRSDVAYQRVVENLATQPDAVSYGVGQETFTYWGDDLKDERTTGLAAIDRITMSEFGFSFMRHINTPGELVYQNRHARVLDTTVQHTFAEADLADMKVRRESSDIKNRVEATVYPRELGSSTETLYSLSSPLLIAGGETKIIKARYTDPGNRDVRLSGKDLFGPEGDNLITTRGAENADLGEWTYAGGAGGSLDTTLAERYKGFYSFVLESGTGAAETARMTEVTDAGTVAPADVINWSVNLKTPDTWPQFTIAIAEYNATGAWLSTTVEETITTPVAEWTRYHGEYTASDTDCDYIQILIGCNTNQDFSGTGGQVGFYSDEILVIKTLNFEFSSSDTGGGDKDGDLLLLDSYLGGNAAEFVLENISDNDGYVTLLQVKGTAIRTYDPVMQFAENAESQRDHHKRVETLSLRYQDDPLVGQDYADKVLSDRGEPSTVLESFDIHGHRSAALLAQVLGLATGERVAVAESVSAIDDEYFIQGADYRGQATPDGVAITATYNVVIATTEAYWVLGIVDSSELGETTWLGF